jgi:hypothetical protein
VKRFCIETEFVTGTRRPLEFRVEFPRVAYEKFFFMFLHGWQPSNEIPLDMKKMGRILGASVVQNRFKHLCKCLALQFIRQEMAEYEMPAAHIALRRFFLLTDRADLERTARVEATARRRVDRARDAPT